MGRGEAVGLVEEEGDSEGGQEERHAQPRGAEEEAAAAGGSGDVGAGAFAADADAHLPGGLLVVGDGDGDALDQRRRRRHGRTRRSCAVWGVPEVGTKGWGRAGRLASVVGRWVGLGRATWDDGCVLLFSVCICVCICF